VEAFDQRVRLRIGLGVQAFIWMAIAREKALEPKHVAVLGAADNDRPARSLLNHADAP
jgi:hypothetical protein